jgi:hypothetical protein
MSLELLDFPPIWRVFDAHSLWHMVTIPIVRMHWDFAIEDSIYEVIQINARSERQKVKCPTGFANFCI